MARFDKEDSESVPVPVPVPVSETLINDSYFTVNKVMIIPINQEISMESYIYESTITKNNWSHYRIKESY